MDEIRERIMNKIIQKAFDICHYLCSDYLAGYRTQDIFFKAVNDLEDLLEIYDPEKYDKMGTELYFEDEEGNAENNGENINIETISQGQKVVPLDNVNKISEKRYTLKQLHQAWATGINSKQEI